MAVNEVVVATDDKRVMDAVAAFGGRALMTSPTCPTGTDRLAEVARFEDVLREHPSVIDAAVVPVPDPLRDEEVKAYVLPAAGIASA